MKSAILRATKASSQRLFNSQFNGIAVSNRLARCISSAEMTSGSRSTPSDEYESPFQEFFDMIDEGRSSLGTTNDTPKPEPRYLKCGVNEEALRYKTMHYGRAQLAPHVNSGEHRVTLKVNMDDIPLNDIERDIVKQIVGNRVNEDRGELRLASDQFGSRIENKRHVTSMLDRIVLGAKRLAKELEQESSQQDEESQGEKR
jgi:hypothetical protein